MTRFLPRLVTWLHKHRSEYGGSYAFYSHVVTLALEVRLQQRYPLYRPSVQCCFRVFPLRNIVLAKHAADSSGYKYIEVSYAWGLHRYYPAPLGRRIATGVRQLRALRWFLRRVAFGKLRTSRVLINEGMWRFCAALTWAKRMVRLR